MNFLKFLKQTCVRWPTTGKDQYGNQTHGDGVELPCRWEDKCEMISTVLKKDVMSKGNVLLVTKPTAGDYLFLGTLATAPDTPLPTVDDKCYMILTVHAIPDLKARAILYKAYF